MLVKTEFTIKDLENLSNIKAHTIRIWEKRYNLLHPNRTETNIRKYSLDDLKKLLNVSFLHDKGYKISKIAALKSSDIINLIRDLKQEDTNEVALKNFKTAMLSFDEALFHQTYLELSKTKTFQDIFKNNFIPLLGEIGMLWQTHTIDPAHEHFISELIKRKILLNIEKVENEKKIQKDKIFCLFLPQNEIHDIGILYANYELKNHGFKTIFLGGNIPLENLNLIEKHYNDPVFLSYFTVAPEAEGLKSFITDFNKRVGTYHFWILGRKAKNFKNHDIPKNVKLLESISNFQTELEVLNKS